MRIAELFGRADRAVFSFEFFPPKTDAGFENLRAAIRELKLLNPDYVSVTWGAGGSTRSKTVDLTIEIQREIGLRAMAHLSCIGSTPRQLAATLDQLEAGGIENVLALGGDRPEGYEPPPGAFTYANELAEFVSARGTFSVGGACYPETHPSAESPEADLAHCKRKVEAGVEFLITQLFFDNADYFDFVARAREVGIEVPIVPGIMPVLNVRSVRRMTTLSGAKIPDALQRRLDEVVESEAATRELGIEWATRQCRELLDRGAPGIHFYTLNKSTATRAIFERLRAG
ncbi:MAG: methylenetetrahydrofolate reductase [NAD(P)H] [Deltaproteobacteria bacterium]|nr:methylenetetrahydrofolate reductase [NAD(P)H] [Deltaproteobacteria bacterium]MBW2360117.1 methylenetetrahydrofolate reductase [NAD(P)H] [Deltaproteobacteria bacterium]